MENNENLLEELVNARLDDAMNLCDNDERAKAFAEAMAATDRLNEMKKIQSTTKSKKEKCEEYLMKGLEIVAVPIVLAVVNLTCNKSLARFIGGVEQMETFTTTPGRTLGKMFKF